MRIEFNTVALAQMEPNTIRAHAEWLHRLGAMMLHAADAIEAQGPVPDQFTERLREQVTSQPADTSETKTDDRPPRTEKLRIMTKARQLAEDNNIDVQELRDIGTGKDGMITQADMQKFIKARKSNGGEAPDVGKDKHEQEVADGDVSLVDVRSKLASVVNLQGNDSAKELLAEFGAKKASEIGVDDYKKFVERAGEMLEEGIMD